MTLMAASCAERGEGKRAPVSEGSVAVTESMPRSVVPSFREGTQDRHERFNAISREGKAKLVFLGDSITQGWEGEGAKVWEEKFARFDAANFGVSGDCTEQVLWRLDHGNFDGLKPKLIVVMIGTNNTGQREESAADTAAGVRAILDRLRSKCPDSKVLLLAIFPREASPNDPLRLRNERANWLISKFDDGERMFYKDIGAAFVRGDGTLRQDLMPDNLHLNAAGYGVWAEAIEADVAKLMGE